MAGKVPASLALRTFRPAELEPCPPLAAADPDSRLLGQKLGLPSGRRRFRAALPGWFGFKVRVGLQICRLKRVMDDLAKIQTLERLAGSQGGVFSLADLRLALAEPHRSALHRRVDRWIEAGILSRCRRGIYVTQGFDRQVLSQRLAPDSALSFETVLADALIIGPRPDRRISAVRRGRSERYEVAGIRVEHRQLADGLRFGEEVRDGVRRTVPEKALLDVIMFHLRGRRALFDIRTDVDLDRLDRDLLREFLERYNNPRAVAFARDVLRVA